ncbi:MAG: Flp pilus assembly complex ATPase component TadA [Candidatus Aenigmarchaeota archaeon]|nr:Flp pilus assembly complex ATPase component TadA [Candidatus Aenigmarchaeota archaeon]
MLGEGLQKIKTGINGLDKLLEGGIQKNHIILISGGAGSGKTTFLCQYMNEGLKNGETCLYITLEESKQQIIEDASQFGWDFEMYEKQKKLFIKQYNPFELSGDLSLNSFEHYMEYIKATRVVIDPISLFASYISHEGIESISGEYGIRRGIYLIIERLKKANATAMMSTEIVEGDGYGKLSRYGSEEFIADGVIKLVTIEGIGKRSLIIKKMRCIKHDITPNTMKITDNGIIVETE